MVAFKSLAGESDCVKPIFVQDEINLKIIMNFLLLAKLMNKVLLTSHVLNSYSPTVYFPDLSKRLNRPVGIHFFNSLGRLSIHLDLHIFFFSKYKGQLINRIGEHGCCQNVDRIMYMLNK